ncbi:MAG: hypothetical protein J5627_01450, partial [Bacilli bacterium]|nr:hypothetical protein [Bacilli bacterium]
MAKKKKDRAVDLMAFLRNRASTIIGMVFLVLAIAGAILLPIAIAINNKNLTWVAAGTLTISSLIVAWVIIHLIRVYTKMTKKIFEDIGIQIRAFADGNFLTVNKEHDHMLPAFSELQKQMNQAIADYSNYRLVYVGKASEEQINKDIESGLVYPKEVFVDLLMKEAQKNESYRSALLLIELKGARSFEEQDFEALTSKVRETFPHSMLGKYDEKTLALYIFNVESFLGLETVCEGFVTNFNVLKIDKSTSVEKFVHAKIGGVIYPYCSLNNFLDEAEKALKEEGEVNLSYGVKDVYYPHRILSESSKRILFLANFEKWEYEIKHAKDYAGEIEALKNAIQWL